MNDATRFLVVQPLLIGAAVFLIVFFVLSFVP